MKQSGAEFGSAPTSTNEYEIREKKYIVTSHCVGGKRLSKSIRRSGIQTSDCGNARFR